jgi:hypothetical protein
VLAEVVTASVAAAAATETPASEAPHSPGPAISIRTPVISSTSPHPPRAADYTQRGVVDIAAIASIVLGAVSLLLGVFFSWALALGALGLAAGIYGFRSRWRQLAIIGLLLSLMGLAGSSARLAYDAFAWWYGTSPLGAPDPGVDSQLPDSLE